MCHTNSFTQIEPKSFFPKQYMTWRKSVKKKKTTHRQLIKREHGHIAAKFIHNVSHSDMRVELNVPAQTPHTKSSQSAKASAGMSSNPPPIVFVKNKTKVKQVFLCLLIPRTVGLEFVWARCNETTFLKCSCFTIVVHLPNHVFPKVRNEGDAAFQRVQHQCM